VWCDQPWLETHFLKKTAFMHEHGAPVWVGEFGPIYTEDDELNATRYRLARDQIDLFERYGASWAIWTYKDIGLQGLVYAAPDSPYIQTLGDSLQKKQRLGSDSWGGGDADLSDLLTVIDETLSREFPDRSALPWDARAQNRRLVRSILFAEALTPEVAARFAGFDEQGIDNLMRSFAFENCVKREGLARVLAGEQVAV